MLSGVFHNALDDACSAADESLTCPNREVGQTGLTFIMFSFIALVLTWLDIGYNCNRYVCFFCMLCMRLNLGGRHCAFYKSNS